MDIGFKVMEKREVIALLEKYRLGKCTDKEKAALESWYNDQIKNDSEPLPEIDFDLRYSELRKEVLTAMPAQNRLKKNQPYKWIAAAASIILLATVSWYFIGNKVQSEKKPVYSNDIGPGGNKATLTLADGRKISLTDAANGRLTEQQGLTVTKTNNGQLVYTVHNSNASSKKRGGFNQIETPVGGQYQVILPDGTKVWLNAATSLRYPVNFENGERRVEIEGEAYFEVHSSRIPFRVFHASQIVDVLATNFDINAYKDEPSIRTTLLQGRVRVVQRSTARVQLLEPGQQSSLSESGWTIGQATGDDATAWKNGNIQFSNANIKSIMRMLARWYDIDVHYQSSVPVEGFWGSVSRNKNISEILRVLESTGNVHFKIEGREVTVMP